MVLEGLIEAINGMICMRNGFSVEINSKTHVKSISISDEDHDRVLFEGNLGDLVDITLEEGDVLEFVGINGVLRVDIKRAQLDKLLNKLHESSLSSEVGSYRNTI